MPAQVLNELLRLGVLGPVLIALGYAYYHQMKKLEASQEARIAEAKATTQLLLKVNDQVVKAVSEMTTVLTKQSESDAVVVKELKSLEDQIEDLTLDPKNKRR